MTYCTQWCNKCKKKIGRFHEKFTPTMLPAKCAVCHSVLEIREIG